MFETYKDLKYKRFINKIQMTEFLNPLTKKIKSGQIKDITIKKLYYYIMDSQYNFEQKYLDLLIDMDDENIEELLKNNILEIKNNNLYKKNEYNAIILVNVDDYLIKDLIKKQILFNNNFAIHIKQYYSIKGLLKHLDFKKEEGDRYWEEFLKSNVLDDLVKSLYKKENIFNQEKIIDLFKDLS